VTLTVGITAAFLLTGVGAACADVIVSGYADRSDATTGDCLGYTLDVSGVEDGVSSEPIEVYLNGPLDPSPSVGDQINGPVAGSFTAVWDGADWQYSSFCVTAGSPGVYVWTFNNLNSATGIEDIASSASFVNVTDAVVPSEPDDDVTDIGSGGNSGRSESAGTDRGPRLPDTGVEIIPVLIVGGTLLATGGLFLGRRVTKAGVR
jgi:LPXTG-motif cell wall-anchored protein